MIRNYIKIAFRNLFRNKLFSFVNIFGLAFGIASALLIFIWINDELEVDRFHAKTDRIYKVLENQQYSDGKLYTFSSTPGPMAPFIKDRYPEIEHASRMTWEVNNLFTVEDKSFYEAGRYVDQDFLQIFSFEFIEGDASKALTDKKSIVISKEMARKFFGNEPALGKIFQMNTSESFTVSGVLADISPSSSLRFQYLLPFEYYFDLNKSWLGEWDNNNIRTFITLNPQTNVAAFSEKFRGEVKSHVDNSNVDLHVQLFGDAYLFGEFENGIQSGGRIEYIRIFFVVAIFVLVIACINFMNLATAQATKRAKEVGLRKVIGAAPRQLFRQFMGESFVMVILSALAALLMVVITLPFFNEIASKSLSLNLLDGKVLGIFLIVIVFTGLVAGGYPSLVISEFKPVQILKGQLKSGSRATVFRKILVVVQFSLSIVLIISTAVVFRQMQFMENRDIGFVRENVFYLWMEGDIKQKFETFRQELLQMPGIESVTASSGLPIDVGNSTSGVQWEGKDPDERILFSNLNIDYNFVQTMKMQMADGRPFDPDLVTDTLNYIVNEKAAEKFGFKGGAAGQDLTMWENKGKIVGVVKDFNFGSLHNPIEPLIMYVAPRGFSCILVRAKSGETEAGLASAEKLWKQYSPGYPFRYAFLDHDWQQYYQAEGQRGKIFNTLAVLSVFISCLGLFGLAAFSAERRTKELGIRKVLGASVSGLIQLVNKEFAILVLISACIGCPAGWYLMDLWLQEYAYHVEVGYVTLFAASAVCLLIAIATVTFHAVKVATANPTKTLRYE